jgi:hypothetical protein
MEIGVVVMAVTVSKEEFKALKEMKKELNDQFFIICHCKGFSGNGVSMNSTWNGNWQVLNKMPPIKFAEALINGFEIESGGEV